MPVFAIKLHRFFHLTGYMLDGKVEFGVVITGEVVAGIVRTGICIEWNIEFQSIRHMLSRCH